jgi:hypothetical protein
MNDLIEVLKYTLPSLVVFGTAYYTLKMFLDKEDKKRLFEIQKGNQKVMVPIRLQAYERIVLFLERISPDALALRVQQPGMNAKLMQMALLTTIRAEFDHNLSQQIYMSQQTWEAVISAKESVAKLVNAASSRLKEDASPVELSKLMIEMYLSVENPPITTAIAIIKEEISENFGMSGMQR